MQSVGRVARLLVEWKNFFIINLTNFLVLLLKGNCVQRAIECFNVYCQQLGFCRSFRVEQGLLDRLHAFPVTKNRSKGLVLTVFYSWTSSDQIVAVKVFYWFLTVHRTFNATRMVQTQENIETLKLALNSGLNSMPKA